MQRLLFDTSALVASLVSEHPHHQQARPWLARVYRGDHRLVLSTHAYAETYSALTCLPSTPRIPAAAAQRMVCEDLAPAKPLHAQLDANEYATTLRIAAELGLRGGQVHDAVIVACAKPAKASVISFNRRHFDPLCRAFGVTLIDP